MDNENATTHLPEQSQTNETKFREQSQTNETKFREQSQTNTQPAQAAQEDISVTALREYYEARERDTAAQMDALRRTLAEREETIHVLMGDRPDAKDNTSPDAFYKRIGLKRRD